MKERKKVVGRRVPCNWKGKYLSKDKKYTVEFEAYGHGWYKPRTYYEPEEDEIECDEIKLIEITEPDTTKVITLTEEQKKDLENEVFYAINNGLYQPDWPDER